MSLVATHIFKKTKKKKLFFHQNCIDGPKRKKKFSFHVEAHNRNQKKKKML